MSIALVHHANQYLVTTGYDDREGIDELVAGYAAVLRLHEERGVPASLHLSGTLLEAAAWYAPWFLELVDRLHRTGLVELVGGTYADGIMTVLPASLNRRGIVEHLALCQRHFRCDPGQVTAFWLPERVWETSSLAPILTSPELANGGFRSLLLDDRLFYPLSPDGTTSARHRFDAIGPYVPDHMSIPRHAPDFPRPAAIAGGQGLVAVPISSWLRYCIPPRTADHWDQLQWILGCAAESGDETLLVYADDLERTAGLASWERGAVPAYAAFLDWLLADERFVPVRLTPWLNSHPNRDVCTAEAGTFFELAQRGAGEDYRGWWDAGEWAPYRRHLAQAEEAIRSAEHDGVSGSLIELAWKHLLASTYETAWHAEISPVPDPGQAKPEAGAPAPWARATASHARSCLPIVAAARSLATQPEARAEVVDIDADGEEEAVLATSTLYAVLSPRRGGRLTALFARTSAGDVGIVGNPADDWNWQEELHRYMERPPNHPGALSDVGFEDDRYEVIAARSSPDGPSFEFVNTDHTSALKGTRKHVLLPADRQELVVCYRWPPGIAGLAVDLCLSPDYLRLLREGRSCVEIGGEGTRRGARVGEVAVWVHLASGEATSWVEPSHRQVGHGVAFRMRSHASHFHLVIGCGADAATGPQPRCHDARADVGGALAYRGA
ncbi:MAG: hypothetical protein M3252_07615 [Actinomycetota bacterium]|nr:hypothetical protein [Actinomycetota bacterium]